MTTLNLKTVWIKASKVKPEMILGSDAQTGDDRYIGAQVHSCQSIGDPDGYGEQFRIVVRLPDENGLPRYTSFELLANEPFEILEQNRPIQTLANDHVPYIETDPFCLDYDDSDDLAHEKKRIEADRQSEYEYEVGHLRDNLPLALIELANNLTTAVQLDSAKQVIALALLRLQADTTNHYVPFDDLIKQAKSLTTVSEPLIKQSPIRKGKR